MATFSAILYIQVDILYWLSYRAKEFQSWMIISCSRSFQSSLFLQYARITFNRIPLLAFNIAMKLSLSAVERKGSIGLSIIRIPNQNITHVDKFFLVGSKFTGNGPTFHTTGAA